MTTVIVLFEVVSTFFQTIWKVLVKKYVISCYCYMYIVVTVIRCFFSIIY